jgi:Outer membrane lipoprotein-sorting protein
MHTPGIVAALVFVSAAVPRAATLDEVLTRVRALRNTVDFTASARLVHVTASGERRSYPITVKAHAFPDGLRIFCEVTSPVPSRVRLLLIAPSTGPIAIRTGRPGDRAPRDLPPERWGEGLLGTNFTYEDLLENQSTWRRQALLPDAAYGARACFVLRSEPGPADQSRYASVTSWLDRDVCSPVKVDKVVKSSGEVKHFVYFGLREVKGVWSASQIECKIEGQAGSSLLIVNHGSAAPHLTRASFDPALLTRP